MGVSRLPIASGLGLPSPDDQSLDVRGQRGIRNAPNDTSDVTARVHASDTDTDTDTDTGSAGAAPSPATDAAAKAVLKHLQALAPMTAWTVTRYDDGDCVLDAVVGPDGDEDVDALAAGNRLPWTSTICSRMVAGAGPHVAPDVRTVPAYATAPIARRLPVGAYIGVPVRFPDGTLAGSICGLDPSPQSAALADVLPVLELAAELLGRLKASEFSARQERERAAAAEQRAVTDALTGITNRLGWDEALVSEQARASRRGLWTGVVSVDLDELKVMNDRHGHHAGDRLLLSAAESLEAVVRREDVLARVGGDEFAVLVSDCDADYLDRLVSRLRAVLDEVGVRASLGAVSVPAGTSLLEAWQLADQQMYAEKDSLSPRQLDLDVTDEALRTG